MSKYKSIDLSAYKTVTVESIRFISSEFEHLEKTCIQASDVLNCISTAINTGLNDRIPYKDTSVILEITGALSAGKTFKGLPAIPYAGITMAGINWGIAGSNAKIKAEEESVETKIETERMSGVLSGLRAIEKRVDEGKTLLFALSAKLKKSLVRLQELTYDSTELSEDAAKEFEISVKLIKSIKHVIETDICNADGFITKKSGVIFHKIEKEINHE